MKRLTTLSTLLLLALLAVGGIETSRAAPDFLGTVRVSIHSNGGQGNGNSSQPDSSHSGQLIAFQSVADNLVNGDNNNVSDIFVRDTAAGTTVRVSRHSSGAEGNGDSAGAAISGDGRYVAFQSSASNLVDNDNNFATDIFVHDRQTGQTTRVSVATGGGQANAPSYDPDISADGRYITFWSIANNLATLDTNGKADVFIHDRINNQTFRASVASNGQQGNDDSSNPSISDNGRYVAFESYASNFAANDLNGYKDIFVHDWQGFSTIRMSVRVSGPSGEGDSFDAHISGNADTVVFTSFAANLVDNDTNSSPDVFMRSRLVNDTQRISVDSNEAQANGTSEQAVISDDARYVAFRSNAPNLVPGDTNNIGDIFLRDRTAGTTERVSLTNGGGQSNDASDYPTMNNNGDLITFRSKANNLVAGDSNGVRDIFERDRRIPPPEVTVDHYMGRQGSEFLFTGRYFDPNSSATIKANEVTLGQANTDSNGQFQVTLCILNSAPNGVVYLQGQTGGLVAGVTIRVELSAPVWGPTGVTPRFCLANSAIFTMQNHFPITARP